MSDDKTGANKYASNSNRNKGEEEAAEKKVEKVVEGKVIERKKPLRRRIAENFTGQDAQSVGHYVLFEVILPRFKDMIFDVGESALRRTLFGDSAKGHSYRQGTATTRGYTPYNTIASSAISRGSQSTKAAPAASSDEFGEIIVETRGEAEDVMVKIANLIETYGMASVSDLKAAVGLTGNFTDEKFGWIGMGGTDIRRVGGQQPGYLLIFPRPEELP